MEPRLTERCPFCQGELPLALQEDGRVLDLRQDAQPVVDWPCIICPRCARPVPLIRSLAGELTVANNAGGRRPGIDAPGQGGQ